MSHMYLEINKLVAVVTWLVCSLRNRKSCFRFRTFNIGNMAILSQSTEVNVKGLYIYIYNPSRLTVSVVH